ncbi:hypothetical protein [Tropicibacter oceani]|uniref:Uncharacterized protein n=1 Tax=Tropicibacter oceani TaxID=3058420 RepID=A0ABY8QIK3_9RHOB|nr:hypothetical protein [Tropicibacter oceani]WGW03627.1 hypothetical protein QF118_17170 [Tropicibacter oceani]
MRGRVETAAPEFQIQIGMGLVEKGDYGLRVVAIAKGIAARRVNARVCSRNLMSKCSLQNVGQLQKPCHQGPQSLADGCLATF